MPPEMTEASDSRPLLHFHGGTAGALAPFGLFFAGVAWLGISGAPNESGFWPILLAALFLSMVLARDRGAWAEAVIAGMSQPMVMIMILAWLFAGVLGALMGASGFVDALIWIADALGVSGSGYVVAAFFICCVVSTSTGTSLGTIILCAPLLYPAGGALCADPALLMGAILGGATFGDNVSPVSDTTIASALTQRADMRGVVKSRLRYALPAAAVALAVYAAFGSASPGAASAAAAAIETAEAASPSPRGLPMLGAPSLVLALLLSRRHLLVGLLAGIAAAVAIGLASGLLEPGQLMRVNPQAYVAEGLIVEGLNKGIGVSIFTLFLMGLVAAIEAAGVIERAVRVAEARTRSRRGAERWTFATMSGAALLTCHTTVAILTVGDFTRRIGQRFGVSAYRRANVLDITGCSWPHIFPWFIPAILTASTTASGADYGMPRLSPVEVGLANAHSWALLGMVLLAVGFGYGGGDGHEPRPSESR